jgi:hypothetical protein
MADNGEGSVGIEMIPVRGTEVSANAGEPPAAYQAPSGETGRGLDIEAGHSLVS